MARQRMTQNQLVLSGQNILKPKRYSTFNMVPGKVIPKDVKINPPKHYEKEAKKAFKVITTNLIAMGALSEQDLPALGLAMDCLNDYYKYDGLIRYVDETMDKDDDEYFKRRDKLVRRKSEAMRNFYLWSGKFGITPADRSRLICETVEKTTPEDPLDILMQGQV